MAVSNCPASRDVQDFQFKIWNRLKIFPRNDFSHHGTASLLASTSKYGFIFVGYPSGFKVITTQSLAAVDSQGVSGESSNFPCRTVSLGSQPSHLAVSCDQLRLAVTLQKNSCAHALIYNVPSFASSNILLLHELNLSVTPNSKVHDLIWNPGFPETLACCINDGSLRLFEMNSGTEFSLPRESQSTCFSWSPKGKQLVVGDKFGALTQYRPDLKAVKKYVSPSINRQVFPINVIWLSNYQFAAVYRDNNNSERPELFIVNAPKVGELTFINYEDICYSAGDCRDPQFYLIHQPLWNVLIVASANSMEVGVLGLQQDQLTWEQWVQEDAARAELPLTANREETYPIGFTFDTSNQQELPWKENQMLPPPPVLQILSDHGVLCLFHVVNFNPSVPQLCSPPELLQDQSGASQFVTAAPQSIATTINNVPIGTQIITQNENPAISVSTAVPSLVTTTLASSWGTPMSSEGARKNLTPKFESMGQPTTTNLFPGASTTGQMGHNLGLGIGVLQSASQPVPSFQTSSFPSQQGALPSFGFGLTKPAVTATLTSSSSSFNFGITKATAPSNFSFSVPVTASTPVKVTKPIALIASNTSVSTTVSALPSFSNTAVNKPATNVEQQPSSVILKVPPIQITPPSSSIQAINELDNSLIEESLQLNDSVQLNDTVYFSAMKEEIATFQAEISKLITGIKSIDYRVGSKEEMAILHEKPQMLLDFWQELKETTTVQGSEIHELKTLMLETFAWTEDARSRHELDSNPSYIEVRSSQGLDPISCRYSDSIRRMMYYIESQLKDINKMLDAQWNEFDSSKKDKRKLKIPSLEYVYQTIKTQCEILHLRKQEVEKFLLRLPAVRREHISSGGPLIIGSIPDKKKDLDLSSLSESLFEISKTTATATSKMKSMLISKQLISKQKSKLQDILRDRSVIHIRPIRPAPVNVPIASTSNEPETSKSISLQNFNFPLSAPKPGGITAGKPVVTKVDANLTFSNVSVPVSANLTKSSFINTDPQKSSLFVFGGLSVTPDKNDKQFLAQNTNVENKKNPVPVSSFSPVSSNMINKDKSNVVKNLFQIAPAESGNKDIIQNKKEDFKFTAPVQSQSAFDFSADSKGNKLFSQAQPSAISGTSLEGKTSLQSKNMGPKISEGSSFKSELVPSSVTLTSNINTSSQVNPLISLGNIVASVGGVGNEKTSKVAEKTVHDNKNSVANQNIVPNTTGSTAKSIDTFKFSFGPQAVISSTSVAVTSTPLTVSTTAQNITLKNPVFASLNSVGLTPTTVSNTNMFGSKEGKQKESSSGGNNVEVTVQPVKTVTQGGPVKTVTQGGPVVKTVTQGEPVKTVTQGEPVKTVTQGVPVKTVTQGGLVKTVTQGGKAAETSSTLANITNTSALSDSSSTVQKVPPLYEKVTNNSTNSNSNETLENQLSTGISENRASTVESASSSLFGSLSLGVSSSKESPMQKSIFGGNSGGNKLSSDFSFGSVLSNQLKPVSAVAPQKESDTSGMSLPSVETSTSSNASNSATNISQNKPESSTQQQVPLPSLFGQLSTDKSESNVIFGSGGTGTAGTVTTASSVITPCTAVSSTATTSTVTSSMLTVTTATTAPFSFKLPSSTTASSIFSLKSTSLFSQPTAAAATTATTVTTSTSTSTSFFGQNICNPTSFSQSDGNVFSQAASSIFGQNPSSPFAPPSSGASLFGQTSLSTAMPFGQTSTTSTSQSFGQLTFGQSSPTSGTQNTFGQASASPAVSSPVFGQASSPGSGTFGSPSSTASFFGSGTNAFGTKSPFEQSGNSIFGQNTAGAFGSTGGSIFGGASGGGNTSSIFGGSTSSGNPFQTSGNSLFGGSPTGGGTFSSSTGQSVAQSGFGGPSLFQNKPGDFGGSPSFSFGSTPSFGSSPMFGGAPSFGSPPKVFGASPGSSFGPASPQQHSSTFETLASQNTISFGNLAQNEGQGASFGSPQSQSMFGGSQSQGSSSGFSGGSTSFGGTSFSSWR